MYLIVERWQGMPVDGIAHGCALSWSDAARLQLKLGVRAFTEIIYV